LPDMKGRPTFSGFLQFLATFPTPDEVTRAASHGPLAQFGCKSASLWSHANNNELVCIGGYGLEQYDFERYARISLNVSIPLTEAFITSATIVLPLSESVSQYPALAFDQEIWNEALETNGDGDACQIPIIVNGIPIGAFSFLCDRINEWNPRSSAVLDGLAAALGLWMSNPASKITGAPVNERHEGLSLTPRQIEILDLVQQGKSNTYISARLGFSQSTVKQELHRVMKRLRVNNRSSAVARATELQLIPQAGEAIKKVSTTHT
jgi:DNA-binding CsgD family transcriptional regulator